MNLDKIRKMNDKQLYAFIKNNSSERKKIYYCEKCGVNIMGRNRRNISVTNSYVNHAKRVCSLCDNCYSDLLDYLGIPDINWGD